MLLFGTEQVLDVDKSLKVAARLIAIAHLATSLTVYFRDLGDLVVDGQDFVTVFKSLTL